MYRHLYQEFLQANPSLIHMAAHSHHYWPDAAKEGILESYEDSKNLADLKWEKILGEVVPKSQEIVSKILNLSYPEQIAFASNTHELLVRLLSCFDPAKKLRVLTTDSEFHSANRQFKRIAELNNVEVVFVPAQTNTFSRDFLARIKSFDPDLIFLSHVFYNTGKKLDLKDIEDFAKAKREDALMCLDGYHAFCAIPSDLSALEGKLFYLAGSYKYAQAGEGMCFMTVPKGCRLRPINTGWFAAFGDLEKEQEHVGYANDGWRFSGSTRDFTAHYRFNRVWESFFDRGIDVESIHKRVRELQQAFLEGNGIKERFINRDLGRQGHFLVLEADTTERCRRLYEELKKADILTDYRGSRLRFGFGLYLSVEEAQKVRAFINSPEFTKLF